MAHTDSPTRTLRAALVYEPQALKFGTSGRRGEVVHLTQLEIYINATAELEYLQSLSAGQGGIRPGDEFYFACDLRPSSRFFVPGQGGRGQVAQAIGRAIADAGMKPVYLGLIPTPALTYYAMSHRRGSIMVTGSHIPFDRNGYKTNSARGELLKKDEAPINARVEEVRRRLYDQPFEQSLFDEHGRLRMGPMELPPEDPSAREAYLCRYTEFFAGHSLAGRRLLVYQHSAVGRDLLVDVLERLGATVIPAGRSETFVPIDTEAIGAEELAMVGRLLDEAWKVHGPIDAVVSTDGDSDRPLVLGVEHTDETGLQEAAGPRPADATPGLSAASSLNREPQTPNPSHSGVTPRFFGGDLVGMVVAEFLGADAVVVPISCNDAVDRGSLKDMVEPKTRIGSPFVIAAMESATARGKKIVCGWEANGGFLVGSDITRHGKTLAALPTRDAVLPILGVLLAAFDPVPGAGRGNGESVCAVFDRLPRRFSRAALLRRFPRPVSLRIVQQFSPADAAIKDVFFDTEKVTAHDERQEPIPLSSGATDSLRIIRTRLAPFFPASLGFGAISRLNYVDGVRVYFDSGDIAHIRPSGNADELRMYAVADSQARADEIVRLGVEEPGGILRSIERSIA